MSLGCPWKKSSVILMTWGGQGGVEAAMSYKASTHIQTIEEEIYEISSKVVRNLNLGGSHS
jgi:hypothetical protein